MKVEDMEAGRAIDIAVAELLSGYSRLEARVDPTKRDGEPQFFWGYPAGHDFAPNYSTDIAAAWEVMKWLDIQAFHPSISGTTAEGADGWEVEYYGGEAWKIVWAPTAPLAISLAALKASGITEIEI